MTLRFSSQGLIVHNWRPQWRFGGQFPTHALHASPALPAEPGSPQTPASIHMASLSPTLWWTQWKTPTKTFWHEGLGIGVTDNPGESLGVPS